MSFSNLATIFSEKNPGRRNPAGSTSALNTADKNQSWSKRIQVCRSMMEGFEIDILRHGSLWTFSRRTNAKPLNPKWIVSSPPLPFSNIWNPNTSFFGARLLISTANFPRRIPPSRLLRNFPRNANFVSLSDSVAFLGNSARTWRLVPRLPSIRIKPADIDVDGSAPANTVRIWNMRQGRSKLPNK